MGFHPMIKHWAQLYLGRLTNQNQNTAKKIKMGLKGEKYVYRAASKYLANATNC